MVLDPEDVATPAAPPAQKAQPFELLTPRQLWAKYGSPLPTSEEFQLWLENT